MIGKQAPQPRESGSPEPSLRVLREGGESGGSSMDLEDDMQSGSMQLGVEQGHGGEQPWVRLAIMQHDAIRNMVKEDLAEVQEGKFEPEDLGEIKRAVEEGKILEQKLQMEEEARIKSMETFVDRQILQTRVVSLEEVRRDLTRWTGPFRKEYESLVSGPVKVVSRAEITRRKAAGEVIETLPMKAVATEKPSKDKGRLVVCGNFSTMEPENDTSVGGACNVAIRGVVHRASQEKWAIGSIDVTGAFLQAPRRSTRTTIVEPPSILRLMNITQDDEVWEVGCALYGFQESPSDWSKHRDDTLKELKWRWEGHDMSLRHTAEVHVWEIRKENQVVGLLTTYVDDMLAAGPHELVKDFFREIKKTWTCSEEEMVSETGWMRYCGYDIKAHPEGGFVLSQSNYLRNLLDKRGIQATEQHPISKVEDEPDELQVDPKTKQLAQALTGELMWLSTRTRPDIGYSVGLMSRLLHRRPQFVTSLGFHILRYLNGSVDQGLRYQSGGDLKQMTILVDASFAPPHEQYRSVQGLMVLHGLNLLMWQSTRQPFITSSTAEAELLGYAEGVQAGLSTMALLETLGFSVEEKILKGDSRAALAICNMETGPWRTRHLRLRAAKIRELLADPAEKWSAQHCPGESLAADGLTKGLLGQAFKRFRSRLGMTSEGSDAVGSGGDTVGSPVESHKGSGLGSNGMVAACALAATAGVLVSTGRNLAGSAVAICAMLIGGRELKKDQKRIQEEEPSRLGKATTDVQDGRHVEKSRATSVESTSQDDEGRDSVYGLSDRSRSVPGIRAMRLGPVSESHGSGDQEPIRPTALSSTAASGSGSSGYRQGGIAARGAAALGAGSDRWEAGDVGFEVPRELEPWMWNQFKEPGKGKDSWDLTLWSSGWVVRRHPVARTQLFHPIHKTLPCSAGNLRRERVTLILRADGTNQVVKDTWEEPRGWVEDKPWRGLTFFRRQGYQLPEEADPGVQFARGAADVPDHERP